MHLSQWIAAAKANIVSAWERRRIARKIDLSTDPLAAENSFGSYRVPKGAMHRPAARAVLLGKVWEPQTLDLLCSTAPTADIIHAGTFFGDGLPALDLSRTGEAQVWAFEPNPESYECAKATRDLNGLARVRLHKLGLSSVEREGRLAVADDGRPLGGASRLLEHSEGMTISATESIILASIDSAIPPEREIGVVHLDVEGHEQSALQGGIETLRRCRPLLVLETMPSTDWFGEYLSPLGYSYERTVEGNHVFRVTD